MVVLIMLICIPVAMVCAHGAWLDRPTISFTPATETQINANIASGNGAIVAGDVIELVATFPAIVSGTVSGPGGYFTFYVPAGTEVVGASVVDASLNDIAVRNATSAISGEGISRGWGPMGQNTFVVTANGWVPAILPSQCTLYGFTAATCNSGLAHIYGDTGIFYSTRADTAFYTGDGTDIASMTNGYQVKPSNATPWTSIGGTGNARVHNKWDAVQSNAFGSSGPLTNPGFSTAESTQIVSAGRASTPYKAGSPVAGPDSGNTLDRYGTTGPWQRVSYPGSCYAQDGFDGPANGQGSVSPQAINNTPTSIAICTPTSAGAIASVGSPLPLGTKAVRYSIGGIDQGLTYRIKIRLRALDPTLIKAFNAEAAGGDSTQGVKAGNDNPWRYFIGGPGVAAPAIASRLSLVKSIVAVNGTPYSGSGTIPTNAIVRYRISYANSGLTPQTNVQISDVLPTQSTATSGFAVISGPSIIPGSPPATGTITFLPIATLGAGAGGSVEFNVALASIVGQTVTNTARISSTERPTPVTHAVSANVVAPVVDLQIQKTSFIYDPLNTGKFHLPGEDVIYTIRITNRGDAVTNNSVIVVDAMPSQISLSRFAFDGTTTEPIKFVDGVGSASSGLTCCGPTNIQYSTDGGISYSYLAPASVYDGTITHIRVAPTGQMNAGIPTVRTFDLVLKGQIK
jgi:large repetitive protein